MLLAAEKVWRQRERPGESLSGKKQLLLCATPFFPYTLPPLPEIALTTCSVAVFIGF
jgi:hypothetical protein